ncbi:MAG TPA: protein translocase subunit SecD [Candidatus Latescibacteria bacterium]|nr:protein translocase subunit SecD [Candidatus Latescibacterota bacterium]
MGKTGNWKVILIVLIVIASLWYLYPTLRLYTMPAEQKARLWQENPEVLEKLQVKALRRGLDLQGGVHLVMEVDLSDIPSGEEDNAVRSAIKVIRNRVDQFGVTEPVIQREGKTRIIVELPGIQDIDRAKSLIGRTAMLEFKLLKDKDELADVLRKIDQVFAELDIVQEGEAAELFEEAEEGKPFTSLLTYVRRGRAYDIAVPTRNVNKVKAMLDDPRVKRLIPRDAQFLWGAKPEQTSFGEAYPLYYLKARPDMSGAVVADARVTIGSGTDPQYAGQPIINFTTTDEGVRIFSRLTGANIGKRLAIVLDNMVYSAPEIRDKIRTGSSVITGSRTMEEARDLAIVLRTGALPAPLNIIEERTVGPSLGADSIRKGVTAIVVGLIVVSLFMLFYYRLSGLIALIALALDLVFILAVLAGFRATLTLPGIAGIILTIGMAVDANVLIYERIREELRAGKTIRAAIGAGYSRAFRTIMDANITTLITAIVLYHFGTGPIRGFALTLSIGILASMFTALFVTRVIFDRITRRDIKRLSIGTLSPFVRARFEFINARKIAFLGSTCVIVIGLISVAVHKGPNYGLDFAGGTLLELHFNRPVAIGMLREALSAIKLDGETLDLSDAEIKKFGAPTDILIRVGERMAGTKVADAIKAKVKEEFKENLPMNERDWLRRQEKVGPKIGGELRTRAVKAILIALVGMLIYIGLRFQFKFALAAVIALFHDVLITTGVFFLLDKEISLAVVAALLTIVGYSLNDTIVVFDRIREGLKAFRQAQYPVIINRSINETLSRTLITSLTTFFVVLSLFIYGGGAIHDFAFALLIGVFVGTYSSIFVASPILVVWHLRSQRRKRSRS